jgi:trigger factor
MKITRKDLSKTKVELTIMLGAAELKNAEEVALVHLGEKMKIAGFRPGKAPLPMIRKQVNPEELASHTLNDAINSSVPQAFVTEKVQALDRPEVEVKKYVPGQELEYTAEVEILPEFTLADYKKLTATAPKVSVLKKDIDEVIERMRQGFAERKEVQRAVKDGDEAVIDFKGFDAKGEAFAGGEAKDYPLVIGSGSFIPGFEEGLIGKKAGEGFDLPVTFPKEYQAAHLAGQKCKFEVTVKEVKEVVLPKVDDEFAAKCGPFTDVKQLQDDIKKEIAAQREHEAREQLKDLLVEELVKKSKPTIPEVLVKDQMKNIETDFTQNMMSRGLTLEQYLTDKSLTREEWEKTELHDAATKRVSAAMVLSEVSRAEGIAVTDEEVMARLQELGQQYPDPKMRAQLDTPEVKNDIANRIVTEKTLDRLIELHKK